LNARLLDCLATISLRMTTRRMQPPIGSSRSARRPGDLDDDLKSRHSAIPWRQLLGMRNILAHEYFIRESQIIWETVRVALPELAAVCRIELARLGRTKSRD
jgi:hypothetical protein